MFERYTEKARRVIFYARDEASQFGTPEIETEHLLLGLLKEDTALFAAFLQRPIGTGALRASIQQRYGYREPFSTAIDLPLTEECKRVLAYAAEEADRFGHRHIGVEHLFLGLLREEKCMAADVLREHGASLKEVRRNIKEAGPWKDERATARIPAGGWGTGSGGSGSHRPSLRVVLEDGTDLGEMVWQGWLSRLPYIGEALALERRGEKSQYRIVDIVWQVTDMGEALAHTGQIILKVCAEEPTNSSPPSPKI